MPDLRILGPLELHSADGRPLRSLHAQPKRLALLAYMAVARGSACRRDTMLALLWPNLDDARARAALRGAVYHLRQVLGDAAIVSGPHDELAVEPAEIRCDAADFMDAIAEARPELAMSYYRGDLLEGFHLRGAPGFDEWRERERSRLRTLAATAAWTAAELHARGGNGEEAARWGSRALELANDDEVLLQRYLRLLEALGDRVRAVLEYEAFARRIRRDYDIAPTMETRRIIEAIRLHITLVPPGSPDRRRERVTGDPAGRVQEREPPGRTDPPRVGAGRRRAVPAWIAAVVVGSSLLAAFALWWVAR